MATGYQGYQGYGDPERAKVDRARQIADLLQQGATDTSPKSFWEGAAQLGKAFIARGAMDKADKAESAYGDSRKKAAELLIGQRFNDPAATAAPLSLTPENVGQTTADLKQGGANNRYANIARAALAYSGDLNSALSMVDGMQRQETDAARYADETKYARGRDAVGDQRWHTTFDYQKERDQVGDTRWNTEFDYRKGRDEVGDTQWGQQFGESKRQFNETMGLNRLKMALEGATANGAPSEDMIRLEREFAKDWKSVQGNFSDIQNQWGRMQSMASRGDAAGDLALVVSFTKMLDPGSVAREGEVALTQKAASLYDQMQNLLPRLEKGDTLLPPETRKALLEAAGQMYNVYNDTFQRLAGDYKSTAEQYRMAPERVMMGYRPSPAAAEAAARAQHANAIPFGGTGEFPIDKFRNMPKPADDVSDLLEKYR